MRPRHPTTSLRAPSDKLCASEKALWYDQQQVCKFYIHLHALKPYPVLPISFQGAWLARPILPALDSRPPLPQPPAQSLHFTHSCHYKAGLRTPSPPDDGQAPDWDALLELPPLPEPWADPRVGAAAGPAPGPEPGSVCTAAATAGPSGADLRRCASHGTARSKRSHTRRLGIMLTQPSEDACPARPLQAHQTHAVLGHGAVSSARPPALMGALRHCKTLCLARRAV